VFLLQAAAQQRNAVAVLRRLPEFGVALLPAQLTALPDKQQLLHSVLLGRSSSINSSSSRRGTRSSSAGDAAGASSWGRVAVAPWRRLGDVLELAELLGMGGQEEQQQVSRLLHPLQVLEFNSACQLNVGKQLLQISMYNVAIIPRETVGTNSRQYATAEQLPMPAGAYVGCMQPH
jgi:hypothetical protein